MRATGLVDPLRDWLVDSAVAHASPAEIDEHGIVGALRWRVCEPCSALPSAVTPLASSSSTASPTGSPSPQPDLLTALEARPASTAPGPAADSPTPLVRMEVKADARCAVVAAASVLAKVERDSLMIDLADPGYGWGL